ncbi:MAG: methylmalonyl-CoA mutase, partial [Bacteroidetes bacterium]
MDQVAPYRPKHKVRIVTAASLFDGHDAAINIMRRIMQSSGAEIIHLGHNRSVQEIVDTAIQEDVQAIAVTSYQGGHMEFFKYMHDLLEERGAGHVKIFGGGGGTILPSEIEELHAYGIDRIYSPDDGRALGLQGMINDVLQQADFPLGEQVKEELKTFKQQEPKAVARLITAAENYPQQHADWLQQVAAEAKECTTPVLGVTGTGGAGKSSLVDELIRRFLRDFPDQKIGILSVDPSKRRTGGALLGDRIRMNALAPTIAGERVFMRSLATRQSNLALSAHVQSAVDILKVAGFDLVILETSGIGQSDTEIVDHSDVSLYVMTPEFGAATQLEKIDMLDFADVIAVNKFDKRGAQDALKSVKKQYQRNHQLWDQPLDAMPVYGAIASQFNDPGVNQLYRAVLAKMDERLGTDFVRQSKLNTWGESEKIFIIPPARVRYLSEISETVRQYNSRAEEQARVAERLQSVRQTIELLQTQKHAVDEGLAQLAEEVQRDLDPHHLHLLEEWESKVQRYAADVYT